MVEPAERAVAVKDLDVVVAKPLQPRPCLVGKEGNPLDGEDLFRDSAQDRRRVPGPRSDLQHPVLRAKAERFDGDRHDIGLGNRLALRDGQRRVPIGELGHVLGQEVLTRNGTKRIENPRLGHAPSRELEIDHSGTFVSEAHALTSFLPGLAVSHSSLAEREPAL
jgi:hypothetical protein